MAAFFSPADPMRAISMARLTPPRFMIRVQQKFMPTSSLSEARFKLPDEAAVLSSGFVLVAGGGKHAELFDAKTGIVFALSRTRILVTPGTL